MAALGAQSIASSYEQLLHVDRDGGGNSTTHVSVKDGDNGTTFGFTIATDALMMSSTNRLEFGDTGTYIHQSADGVLDLVSDTEIEINATTIDINGAVAMDGAMTGGTNITISGELDAATLDISGNADIDGTLEADAYTVDGTALDEFIADTVGAMVGSNTETGVAVTYEDGDNTLDFVLGAAQTTITSLLAADIKIGEDDETKIDFETANEIHFYANNTEQVYVADNIFGPQSDSDVDLGTTGVRWKDAFVDSITVTGEIDGASLDIEGNADINGTTNLDAVDIDGAVQIDATFTSGVDGQGYDTKFFGDTSSAYMMWDTSADALVFGGSAVISTQDATVSGVLKSNGGVVFNEDSADVDFRVESNGNANMLVVDGGNNKVGIGENVPLGTMHVKTSDSGVSSPDITDLVVETSGSGGISILTGTGGQGEIAFGDSGDPNIGRIAYNHGGNYLATVVNTVEAMRINSAGAVTAPTTPAFLARPASDQNNFAENSNVTVVLGTEIFDQGSNFASNTFTAPVTGRYQLSGLLYLQNIELAAEYYEFKIVTSNRTYFNIFNPEGLDADDLTYWSLPISVLADMDAGDTATLQIRSGGTASDETADIGTGSYFSGYLAC